MAFRESDSFRYKLLRILETAGEEVLRYALVCGTAGKPNDVTLDDYVKNLPPDSTANINKMLQAHHKENFTKDKLWHKHFTKAELCHIMEDKDYRTWDIILLYKTITFICENLAGTFDPKWTTPSNEIEFLLRTIKTLRNEVLHDKRPMPEQEYLDKVQELRHLFPKALEATKDRYNRDESELTHKLDEVMRTVDAVMREHVGTEQVLQGRSSPPTDIESRTKAFTRSDCFRYKLLRMLETGGQEVLHYTLMCGTDGKPNCVTLGEYLRNLPPSSTANFNRLSLYYLRKHFTRTDLIQMERDVTCKTYDLPLLHKAIKLACENVAGMNDPKWSEPSSDIEYLVTKIKNLRNDILHERTAISELEYLEKVEELKDLFSKALAATKERYNRDDTELKEKIFTVMLAVDAVVGEHIGFEEVLRDTMRDNLSLFQQEISEEIRNRLDSLKSLYPLHFLSGYEDTKVDVHDIFSKTFIKRESDVEHSVNHLRLLSLLPQGGRSPSSPRILVVKGEPGSGKTALLTFLLAEWLREEPQRCMEGLQDFDLLLWVSCCHESSSSLESFVQKTLPEADLKYKDFLLPILKKASVLFIVDGLDEATESSRRLVNDILRHGEHCSSFTVLCTSRPEGLTVLEANMPQNFRVFHSILEGIPTQDRADFVVRHITNLKGGEALDITRLRQLMRQIGWWELFQLPLNLLYLSFMYMEDPTMLSARITQTEWYQRILSWSIEKLHSRVAVREEGFRGKISEILKVAFEASFQALFHDTVYLREEDLATLVSACGESCEVDVLSAFFCLQREVVDGLYTDKYRAPHRGLLEFFAARHISGCLEGHTHKRGDIRRLLEGHTHGQDLQLQPLKNVLCHLLGILSSQAHPAEAAIEETVDLIRESGVDSIRAWMPVLAETNGHRYARTQVASYDTQGDLHLPVHDRTVHVAAALLPSLSCKFIDIILEMEQTEEEDALFPALAGHKVQSLRLMNHYKQPRPPATSAHRLQQCPKSFLRRFVGHLDAGHLQMLPQGLGQLSLCVAGDEHAQELLRELQHIKNYCPNLYGLYVHVPGTSVALGTLAPLPGCVQQVHLVLSGMAQGETETACSIAAAMCPEKGYDGILFPGASLDNDGCTGLLEALAAARVRMKRGGGFQRGVCVPLTATIKEDVEEQLNTLAKSKLRCVFQRYDDEFLWRCC